MIEATIATTILMVIIRDRYTGYDDDDGRQIASEESFYQNNCDGDNNCIMNRWEEVLQKLCNK